ncbi:hypothetical protein GH714_013223 [Hevea brasiliensis]|uniref:Protein kinase domain-containing protein n=1 Tax=Hevea brasiliensis TaxID=3981 RepID=A0A6A6MYS2_HEVBR|nr:hypothetical protein GH714_013223 [Hevea brasiliensis]
MVLCLDSPGRLIILGERVWLKSLHIDVKQDDDDNGSEKADRFDQKHAMIIFSFGLLSSRLSGNTTKRRPTAHVWRLIRAEEFTLAQIAAATNYFLLQNKIGVGSSYDVYRGKLPDGNEVAVKKGYTGKTAVFKDEDNGDVITSIVDFAATKILANELVKVLDHRIGPPVLD